MLDQEFDTLFKCLLLKVCYVILHELASLTQHIIAKVTLVVTQMEQGFLDTLSTTLGIGCRVLRQCLLPYRFLLYLL